MINKTKQNRIKFRFHPRETVLENLWSGRISKAANILEFCKKNDLHRNARLHITPILDGIRAHYKNWYLPSYLNKKLDMKDVFGNKYQMTIRELLKRRKMSNNGIGKILKGKILCCGLFSSTSEPKNYIPLPPRVIKGYTIRKGNSILTAKTQTELAQKLHVNQLHGLVHGFQDNIKGWKMASVRTEKRSVLKLN